MDTQPDLPVVESRWLPAGAWRWIAAAVPAGAVIGMTAAVLVGSGPVVPDTGADRAPGPTALATPPPADTTTREAPAPRSTPPIITVERDTSKGTHDPQPSRTADPAQATTTRSAPSDTGPGAGGLTSDAPSGEPSPPPCPVGGAQPPPSGDDTGTPAPLRVRAPCVELDVPGDLPSDGAE